MYRLPAVTAAIELDVFEALATAPATHEELARRLGLSERATEIILPLFAALGPAAAGATERYQLADVARLYLLRGSPYYWGGLLNRMGPSSPHHAAVRKALKGEAHVDDRRPRRPAERCLGGRARRDRAGTHDRQLHAQPLDRGCAGHGAQRRLLRAFAGCSTSAAARAASASRWRNAIPGCNCTIMELPAMCEVAKEYVAAAGLERAHRHARGRHVPAGMAARLRRDVLLQHPARLGLRHLRAAARQARMPRCLPVGASSSTRPCSTIPASVRCRRPRSA